MAEVLKKFGRYFLLDQIAQGGMAEIYRARMASVDGAGRLLVIKRIQAGYGTNNEFLQMFKSEIKVTMGFSHPNIVQLHDFGEEQEQPYIAMEYIDGKNLRQFLNRFTEQKKRFPVDLAAFIVEQAAAGLHYAHTYRDKISSQPLNIVHRDISPQNILISFDGSVKVIDFGIAKASNNSESTRAGVIKGKPSYLSPEQIMGVPLDGRCDIFALGAVLWELLTGRKLFAGENDLAVLKMIESSNTHVKAPSSVNPEVPKELDYIVLKTLAKQREQRYQSAEELQRALHRFLYSSNPDFNPSDIAYISKDLFKKEIVEDRKLIQKLNEKVEALLSADAPAPSGVQLETMSGIQRKREDTTTIVDTNRARPGAAAQPGAARPNYTDQQNAGAPAASSARSETATDLRVPRQASIQSDGGKRKPWLLVAAALIGVVVYAPEFGINIPTFSKLVGGTSAQGQAELVLKGSGEVNAVLVNGQRVAGTLPARITNIDPGRPFQVSVQGPGGIFEQSFTLAQGERKQVEVKLAARGTASSGGTSGTGAGRGGLDLRVLPVGVSASITVDGRVVDPNGRIPLSVGAIHEVLIQSPGFHPVRREVRLFSAQDVKELRVELEPIRFGILTIRTTPSADAVLTLGDMKWEGDGWSTPIIDRKMPVGEYQVYLNNRFLGMEKRLTIVVEEGKSTPPMDIRLEIKD